MYYFYFFIISYYSTVTEPQQVLTVTESATHSATDTALAFAPKDKKHSPSCT